MKYIIYLAWFVGLLTYFRASQLAQGNNKWKVNQKETFLHGQIFVAAVFVAGLVIAVIYGWKIFSAIFIIDLVFDFLFYLQPTPRTASTLLKIVIIVNLALLAYLLIFPGVAASMY